MTKLVCPLHLEPPRATRFHSRARTSADPKHPRGRGAHKGRPQGGRKPPHRSAPGKASPSRKARGRGRPGGPGDPDPTQEGRGATQGRGATKVRMPVRQAKPQPTIDIELAPDHQHAPSAVKPTLGIKLKTILHVVMAPLTTHKTKK